MKVVSHAINKAAVGIPNRNWPNIGGHARQLFTSVAIKCRLPALDGKSEAVT